MDELVKRLRASCESCKLWDGYKCCLKGECSMQTRLQAANAIEELSKLVDESIPKDDAEIIIAEVAKPRWIPVTERLPEFGVRALCKCRASIYEVLTWTADGWEHDPQHIYMSGFVTHWMPLPTLPKEE